MTKEENINRRPCGILTKEEITDLGLIVNADDSCYAHTSYDLRLGDDYFIPLSIDDSDSYKNIRIEKCSKHSYLLNISPFSSVLISTFEEISLPVNVCGRFDLRIDWALSGLLFQVGTQVEPGYTGRLYGLLYNLTDRPIIIRSGNIEDKLLTIEFHYTSMEAKIDEGKSKKRISLVDFLSEGIVSGSFASYKAKIEKDNEVAISKAEEAIENAQEVLKIARTSEHRFADRTFWFIGAGLVFITLVLSLAIPTIVTKLTYDKGDFPITQYESLINLSKMVRDEDGNKYITRDEFLNLLDEYYNKKIQDQGSIKFDTKEQKGVNNVKE